MKRSLFLAATAGCILAAACTSAQPLPQAKPPKIIKGPYGTPLSDRITPTMTVPVKLHNKMYYCSPNSVEGQKELAQIRVRHSKHH